MPRTLNQAVSLLLLTTLLAAAGLFGWNTGWISHDDVHGTELIVSSADTSDHDGMLAIKGKLTDAQHQLLHDASHHPVALTAAGTQPDVACSDLAFSLPAYLGVPTMAFAPPLRPPRAV